MKKTIIITTFIWIGFVCAISFMEAWLKFQAPNITIKLGLGIGQLVFKALNIMEIVFASIIVGSIIYEQLKNNKLNFKYSLIVVIIILILQTFWLLPALNERATLIMQDITVPKSNLHFLFVLFELVKVIGLAIFGINFFNLKKE